MPNRLPLRCVHPGKIQSPSRDENGDFIEYDVWFAKEPNTLISEQDLVNAGGIDIEVEVLRCLIDPRYKPTPSFRVRFLGEEDFSGIKIVRPYFIAGQERFWIIAREVV